MSTPHNPYTPPQANLTQAVTYSGNGSIANGVAGNYDFSIQAILSEAWSKVSGFKGACWLGVLFYAIVAVPLEILVNLVVEGLAGEDPARLTVFTLIGALAKTPLIMPVGLGIFMLGLKRSAGMPVEPKEVFAYFHKAIPLFLTFLLSYVLLVIGFMLFILPGIYLSVAYALALPLVVEKNLSPWQALETSRKAITHRWFGFFGLYLVVTLIFIVAAIPFGIGLIWALPMILIAGGIVYRNIFGFGADQAG